VSSDFMRLGTDEKDRDLSSRVSLTAVPGKAGYLRVRGRHRLSCARACPREGRWLGC
jgi:hypothetical protein